MLTALVGVRVLCLLGMIGLVGAVAAQSPSDDSNAAKVVRITYETTQGAKSITGELVAERPGLGHLLLGSDGVLVVVSPDQFESLEELSEPLSITPANELGGKVLEEMPVGSKFFTTDHYVVCYNKSD